MDSHTHKHTHNSLPNSVSERENLKWQWLNQYWTRVLGKQDHLNPLTAHRLSFLRHWPSFLSINKACIMPSQPPTPNPHTPAKNHVATDFAEHLAHNAWDHFQSEPMGRGALGSHSASLLQLWTARLFVIPLKWTYRWLDIWPASFAERWEARRSFLSLSLLFCA